MLFDSNLTTDFIKSKLSGYIKKKGYSGGFILAYFPNTDEFFQWTEDELANIKKPSEYLKISSQTGQPEV